MIDPAEGREVEIFYIGQTEVSGYTHGERNYHYLGQYGGKDHARRVEAMDLAWQQATAEMLDEIHAMLRHLCGRTPR